MHAGGCAEECGKTLRPEDAERMAESHVHKPPRPGRLTFVASTWILSGKGEGPARRSVQGPESRYQQGVHLEIFTDEVRIVETCRPASVLAVEGVEVPADTTAGTLGAFLAIGAVLVVMFIGGIARVLPTAPVASPAT